jgi:hypothetical protein
MYSDSFKRLLELRIKFWNGFCRGENHVNRYYRICDYDRALFNYE